MFKVSVWRYGVKIKTLAATIILCTAIVTRAHSFGVGAQFNFSTGEIFAPGAALVISPSDMTHLAVNWYLDFDNVNIIGLTLDMCPVMLQIADFNAGSFNFTLGAGLFATMVFADDRGFNGGLRIPVGLNILMARKVFEIYGHVAPSFGVHFLPSLKLSSQPFFPTAIGIRLWFR